MSNESDYVMYLFVNEDLKMGKGKIASQVGHCVQHMVEEILRSYYENKKIPDCYERYMRWKIGAKKII